MCHLGKKKSYVLAIEMSNFMLSPFITSKWKDFMMPCPVIVLTSQTTDLNSIRHPESWASYVSDVFLLSCSSNALHHVAHLQSNMSFDAFVHIVKCICISCQIHLVKCICLFCQIFCIMICLHSTHIGNLSVTSPAFC